MRGPAEFLARLDMVIEAMGYNGFTPVQGIHFVTIHYSYDDQGRPIENELVFNRGAA